MNQQQQKDLTIDELKEQIAAAEAETKRLKDRNDELTSENVAKTRQLHERMTAEELKKLKEAERDEQFKAMQQKIAIMETVNTCMDTLSMDKATAQRYAEARANEDIKQENEILRQHMRTFKESLTRDFLKNRKDFKTGHNNSNKNRAMEIVETLPKYNTGIDENILKHYM